MRSPSTRTLFLCWSGHRSKQVAEAFKEYFNTVFTNANADPLPQVEMSETLITKGAPWSAQLITNLKRAQAGIVCLTPENRSSAWLHFEGGAIATHKLARQGGADSSSMSSNSLFSFLFTMEMPQISGPLSLFQATTYLRDYDRDKTELSRLTQAVLERFKGCAQRIDEAALSDLVGKLRELQFLGFRDLVPGLEGYTRLVIQGIDNLSQRFGRVQALSAIWGLRRLLEDRDDEMKICAPSQRMFFNRLIEVLSASGNGLERALVENANEIPQPVNELVDQLRRILEVAVEPLVPVLDDSWRYAFYAVHERQEAYRKQKLLLIHPLESTLQRAELDQDSSAQKSKSAKKSKSWVPAGHLLSANEKRRALRSYWAYDRIAAYIHYCEDVSPQEELVLRETLVDLTRAVLKEISLLEVPRGESNQGESDKEEFDDLPLRFAVRALILKVKIGIGHGSYRAVDLKQEPHDDQKPKLNKEIVREIIESRIKGETGLSFESVEELIDCLRKLNDRIGSHSNVDLKPPLLRMCDDLERLIPTGAITSKEQAS